MLLRRGAARLATAVVATVWLVIAATPVPGADPLRGDAEVEGPPVSDAARTSAFDQVEAAAQGGTVRALVDLDVDTTLEADLDATAVAAQRTSIQAAADVVEDAVGGGGEVIHRYTTLPHVSVEISAAGVRDLFETPQARSISELDMVVTPQLSTTLPAIGAPDAWTLGAEGTGQLIAIIDSGLNTSSSSPHPGLAARATYEACFSRNQCPGGTPSAVGPESSMPCQDHPSCGHGTAVTGIAAAVAPGAEILSIRAGTRVYCPCFLYPEGVNFHPDDILAAVDHVVTFAEENPTAPPIAALNLSLAGMLDPEDLDDVDACDSHPDPDAAIVSALKLAVDELGAQGVAVIAGTGNGAVTDQVGWPACTTGVIAVGATDVTNEEVASYSNSSPKVDLLAPGGEGPGCASVAGIEVPWDDGILTTCTDSGTSYATPHVAGAWAALRELTDAMWVPQRQSLEVIREALVTSGTPVTDSRNDLTRPALSLDTAAQEILDLPDLAGIGGYEPIAPTRIVDTTTGTGTCDGDPCDQIPPATEVRVQVAGEGPVPEEGVVAVHVRLTALDAPGGLAVNLDGAIPGAAMTYTSNGPVDAVSAVARLDEDGTIGLTTFFSTAGATLDVLGYFGSDWAVAALAYQPLPVTTLADTGQGIGSCSPSPCAPLAANTPVIVDVDPAAGVHAVALNVSITGAAGPGTVWIEDGQGVAATFQVDAGHDVADLVTTPGDVTIESSVAVDVKVDQVGEFGDDGGRLALVTPTLLVDTDGPSGTCEPSPCEPVGPEADLRFAVPSVPDVRPDCISAAVLLVGGIADEDPVTVEVGPEGDGARATLHLPASTGRLQLALAVPDEDGMITLRSSGETWSTVVIHAGWLACPSIHWPGVLA